MSKPHIFVLKNGLQIIFIKNSNGKAIAIDYRVRAGSNFESKTQIGAAHLIEHLLISKNKEYFTNNGSRILGITSRNECLYYIKSLKEHFEDSIKGLKNLINTNTITQEELDIEKSVVKQEIKRVLNNPEREIQRRSYIPMYPNTRLEKLNTGEIEDINSITLEEVKNFFNKHYTALNSVITITGNISLNKIEEIVSKHLETIKKGEEKLDFINIPVNNNKEIKNSTQIYKIQKNIYSQVHTKINYYGYKTNQKEKYALEYVAFILNNHLNQELRYNKGLAYKINVENFSSINYGMFSIYICSDNSDIHSIVFESIKNLNENIEKINIEIIKNSMVSSFIFDIEKPSKMASFYSENYLLENYITIENEIRNIKKVTVKDIKNILKKLLIQEPKVVILK